MMATPVEASPRIDVILGRCDDMRAEVYVRGAGLPPAAEQPAITGTLAGPETRLAVTLPTVSPLADLGPGPTGSPLARAILTEPGYWTPELPHRYRLVAEVRAGSRLLASCERHVGLRRLGVRGRSFWLEGRRWVPRGVASVAGDLEPAVFRDLLATAVIDDPAEDVCDRADETGVAIAARCGADAVAACGRWARHASVMLAVLPRGRGVGEIAELAAAIGPLRGTMLLGFDADAAVPPPRVPEGIDFLVMTLAPGAVPHVAWREPPVVPVVAARAASGAVSARRAACDRLQADLAAWRGASPATWDWAGFMEDRFPTLSADSLESRPPGATSCLPGRA